MRNDDLFSRSVSYFRGRSMGRQELPFLLPNELEEPSAKMDALLHFSGAHVIFGGGQPRYDGAKDIIYMPYRRDFVSDHRFYEVYCHELIHWTKSRVGRQFDTGDLLANYALEEFVAQHGGMLLLERHGISTGSIETDYLLNYAQDRPMAERMLTHVKQLAEKAADYLVMTSQRNQARG